MELARMAIGKKLAEEGIDWAQVETLQIDAKAKRIALAVALEGEPEPIEVAVVYRLEGKDLVIADVEASRPWVTGAVRLFLGNRGDRFRLPGGVKGAAIRLVL